MFSLIFAWLAHSIVAFDQCCANADVDLALNNMLSLIGWMTPLVFFVACLFRNTQSLAPIVSAMALIGLISSWLFTADPWPLSQIKPSVVSHILIALPAFGLLCIGFGQAILILIQERLMRSPGKPSVFATLPSLQTMDSNLFYLIGAGFVLLAINFLLGVKANHELTGNWLSFNHHVLLILVSTLGFGFLLLARRIYGWRGRPAAVATICCFIVLFLAYYGTRFVSQILID